MSSVHLLASVEQVLGSAGLLAPNTLLVAAVSGGPDSVALLAALHALAQPHRIRLHVAHLNHSLRGAESDADAQYVAAVCLGLGVPLTAERADVAELKASRRLSWEAAAREARYEFLTRVASRVGASAVALGHTADDQAETVLLHLLRGTGIRGLRGMLPVSRWRRPEGIEAVTLVRPLLQVTRRETETYCAEQGLAPRHDSSNLEDRFTRNRIRHRLLPQLEEYNPAVRLALLRLAAAAARDVAYIDGQAQVAWPSVAVREPWGIRLDRAAFKELHPSLQTHLLQRAYAEVAGESSDLSLAQVEGMRNLAEQGAGRALSLSHGVRFATTYRDLYLARRPPASPWPCLEESALPLPSESHVGGWMVQVRRSALPRCLVHDDPFRAYLSLDAVGGALRLRNRASGDRFQPLGLESPKKLKEFMIDAHIPREWRDSVPLVVAKQGIAWVVGWRIAHWARVTPETKAVAEITFSREV